MILGRLSRHQDKSSLAGALIKGGFVVVKAGKLVLAMDHQPGAAAAMHALQG